MSSAEAGLQFPREWAIVDTLGPVASAGGLKNWDLCLARDAIIAWPRGIWLSIKAGIFAGLFGGLAAGGAIPWKKKTLLSGLSPGAAYARPEEVQGERILVDEGSKKWRRYLLGDLEEILVKKARVGYDEIRIKRNGQKPDVYGIGDHKHTQDCRTTLSRMYSALYREEGFEDGA